MRYMNILRWLFGLVLLLMWQSGNSQLLITEAMKNEICYQAFGTELTEEAVFPDGTIYQTALFPDRMVTVKSLISGQIWRTGSLFETLKFDMLQVSAVSDWADQVFLVMGTEVIHFDIYYSYSKVMKRLLRILKKYQVDETLHPLFCAKLSKAYLWVHYNHWDYPMSVIERMYKEYW